MKRKVRFGSSGTWTVPAGVFYADVYGSGGGAGVTHSSFGNPGSSTTVALTGGTVTLPGRPSVISTGDAYGNVPTPGKDGTGSSATGVSAQRRADYLFLNIEADEIIYRGGGSVTPGSAITVTIGAGGTGTGAGGSGYAVIEYEV
jgi:hypothetical protein